MCKAPGPTLVLPKIKIKIGKTRKRGKKGRRERREKLINQLINSGNGGVQNVLHIPDCMGCMGPIDTITPGNEHVLPSLLGTIKAIDKH